MDFRRDIAWIFALLVLINSVAYSAPDSPNGLIILMTDLGHKDFSVGAMKGSIYNVFPQARIDSISHDISHDDTKEAAYILAKASSTFPHGTVFVAVVGAGEPIALKTRNGNFFLAPDNGILTRVGREMDATEVRGIKNPAVMRQDAQKRLFLEPDIFGPTAAHLANGFPFEKVGPLLESYVEIPEHEFPKIINAEIIGKIDGIDERGNVTTNIRWDLLLELGIHRGQVVEVEFESGKKKWIRCEYVRVPKDVPIGEYVGWSGNRGVFQMAIHQGNLAGTLNLKASSSVTVRKVSN